MATSAAHAVYLLGVNGKADGKEALVACLKDKDAMVRRRACEALIRANIEPEVAAVWPLLGEEDRFVRTAARWCRRESMRRTRLID